MRTLDAPGDKLYQLTELTIANRDGWKLFTPGHFFSMGGVIWLPFFFSLIKKKKR